MLCLLLCYFTYYACAWRLGISIDICAVLDCTRHWDASLRRFFSFSLSIGSSQRPGDHGYTIFNPAYRCCCSLDAHMLTRTATSIHKKKYQYLPPTPDPPPPPHSAQEPPSANALPCSHALPIHNHQSRPGNVGPDFGFRRLGKSTCICIDGSRAAYI